MDVKPCVLVTGADGLVGRHIVRALRVLPFIKVVGVVRKRPIGEGEDFCVAELADQRKVASLRELNPFIIIHAAAVLPKSLEDRQASAINETIDHNVFLLASSCGAKVLFFSSIGVYSNSSLPWNEDGVIGPLPTYGAAKYRSELRLKDLSIDSVIFRLSSPYSAYFQDRGGVLFYFVRQAVAGTGVMVTGMGTRAQDFIHAFDVARAVLAVVVEWCNGRPVGGGGLFNIGSGEPITMKALAGKVVQICGTGEVIIAGENSQDDGYCAELSIFGARKYLGWEPIVSLDVGIAQLARRMRGEIEDWFDVRCARKP